MIFNSATFWTLVVAVLGFVIRFFYPNFPFDDTQILSAVLFLLGLFGVVPQLRYGLGFSDLLKSLAFWTLVAGLVSFVVHFYAPTFPMQQTDILAAIVFVLSVFGINPQLRALLTKKK